MQTLSNGRQLGGYTIIRLVGRGGMGEVYEAYETALQRHVALKIINPGSHDKDDLIRRFMIEARTLAKVNHPNVVTIFAIDQVSGMQFIAMEFVEGVAVKELLKHHTLSTDEALPLFEQMLEGLKCLHENKIIHRDLKPHNLLVRPNLQVKILDFGIAKTVGDHDSDLTGTGLMVGTVPYMAPEVKQGIQANVYSDLWSMGAIFYECLVGQSLYSVMVERADDKKVVFPEDMNAGIPQVMQEFIKKMCAARPVDRFPNAAAAIAELQKIRNQRPPLPYELNEALKTRISAIANARRIDSQRSGGSGYRTSRTPKSNATYVHRKTKARFVKGPHTVTIALAAAVAVMAGFVWWATSKQPSVENRPQEFATLPPSGPLSAPVVLSEPQDKRVLWLEPTQIPSFKWSRSLEIGEYEIQIAQDPEFKRIVLQEPVTGSAYRPAHVLKEAQYYWRLVPKQPTKPFVDWREFTISWLNPLELSKPDAQHVFEVSGQNIKIPFAWNCKAGANRYRLQVSNTSNFKSLALDKSVDSCQFTITTLTPGSYYWRARMESNDATTELWSETRLFSIRNRAAARLETFQVNAPKILNSHQKFTLQFKEGVRSIASLPTSLRSFPVFQWQPLPGARGYSLQLSLSRNFSELISEETTLANRFEWKYPIPGEIYWRVRAHNGDDVTTNFSERGTIRVELPTPKLNSKYSLTAKPNSPATLSWTAVPMAEKYVVEVYKSREIAGGESHLVKDSKWLLSEAPARKFVRIAAANDSGERISDFSSLASVDVKMGFALDKPVGLEPSNGARAPSRNGRLSVVFLWSKISGAQVYTLQIAKDKKFENIIDQRRSANEQSVLKQAPLKGKIFWRVRAESAQGNSDWSEPFSLEGYSLPTR